MEAMRKLGAKELRRVKPTEEELARVRRIPLYIILDNVLDTYNVGSIFRLADAVGVEKIFLCGATETPPNPKIKKASVGTWRWVDWEQEGTAATAIRKLKKKEKGLKVFAVEQSPKSVFYDKVRFRLPLAIVVGHETEGVSPAAQKLADEIIEIPLWGINKSLNVMVSAAVVLFKIMEQVGSKEGG